MPCRASQKSIDRCAISVGSAAANVHKASWSWRLTTPSNSVLPMAQPFGCAAACVDWREHIRYTSGRGDCHRQPRRDPDETKNRFAPSIVIFYLIIKDYPTFTRPLTGRGRMGKRRPPGPPVPSANGERSSVRSPIVWNVGRTHRLSFQNCCACEAI